VPVLFRVLRSPGYLALKNTDMLCAKMEEFVVFFYNGGEKAKFDEYLSLYLKDNCSDGKVNVRNEINISYLVSHLSLQHVSKDFETEKTIWNSGGVMLSQVGIRRCYAGYLRRKMLLLLTLKSKMLLHLA
jgi:hypothetical protein